MRLPAAAMPNRAKASDSDMNGFLKGAMGRLFFMGEDGFHFVAQIKPRCFRFVER